MNILLLTPYLPYPLNSGGAQAVFNMIDQLRHQHHYTIVISQGSGYNPHNIQALQEMWPEVDIIYYPLWRQILYLPFVYERSRRVLLKKLVPNSRRLIIETATRPYGEWFSPHHVRFISQLIETRHIELVQVEFYECLPWSNHLPRTVKKIFIHHELGFVRKQRLLKALTLSAKEQQLLEKSKQAELADLAQYDAVITVTQHDKEVLEGEGLATPIYVSTLAIQTPSYPSQPQSNRLVFVGSAGHQPNKEGIDWFIDKVAPLLKKQQLTLDIIGNYWPDTYTDCQDIKVYLKGFVENLPDVALGCIMIVPILSGSGMRMKILEAAAMSLPIVTTTVGVEGIDLVDGESCLIADTPDAFANAILRLEHDTALCRGLGEQANRVFRAKYHPSALAKARNEIYSTIIQSKP